MTRTIVFDVNETLLDLAALDPVFEELFGDPSARTEWFQQMLRSAFVTTAVSDYHNFATLGGSALEAVGTNYGVAVGQAEKKRVVQGICTLPPHPDVRPALEQLTSEGFRLATLTNSTSAVGDQQIANAGLSEFFERTLSADAVRRLKPAAAPYHYTAAELGVEISKLRLVAAHSWDVYGALQAGCAAAFVARPGMALDPIAPKPDITGDNLIDVAEKIIATDWTDPT